jgi:hypothetical protein
VRPSIAIVVKEIPEESMVALGNRMLETDPMEVLIAEALNSRGFPVVDPARTRQYLDPDRLRQILEGDNRTAVALGLATDADVVVTGTVQRSHENREAAGVNAVRARLAVRAVSAATGAALGSTLLDLTGPDDDAIMERTADSAVAELSALLLGAWRNRTSITEIHAENADYQRVQLLKSAILNEVRGADSVKTLSLAARLAVIEVFSQVPSDELVVQLDRCNTAIPFVVKAFSDNRLDIRFVDSPEQCEPDLR